MLNNTNIILIIIIAILLVIFIFGDTQNNEGIENVKTYQENDKEIMAEMINKRKKNKKIKEKDVVDDVISWDGTIDGDVITKERMNPNFLDMQFHNDYRDLITAFNNLVHEKKQKFNLANIPLVYSEPEVNEVKNLVSDFINVVNINLKNEVPNVRNKNSGWDEAIPDPNVKSGWTKVQDSLGLASSLWNDPAKKNKVKLININRLQKYETEDEIKYSIEMVLQKPNVEDQIVIKGEFVQDKRPLNDENNFFVTKNIDMKVIIEDIFILGYLSNYGNDARLQFDGDKEKFYDYNILEYNNMTDPKLIQRILMEKYKDRTEEMEQRNAMLDEEGQNFHRTLPNVYDFSNIRGTRTIYDDMNMTKDFI